MENASKALLIAGAILLVIAIIAIGVGIVSKTRRVTDSVGLQLSAMEIEMHNKKYLKYESENGLGIMPDKTIEEVRECISEVIAENELNKNNLDRIVYVSYHVFLHSGGTQASYLNDNLGGRTNRKCRWHSGTNWPISIVSAYNADYNKEYVINNNKTSAQSLYWILLEYDENGYIWHILISKNDTVGITNTL